MPRGLTQSRYHALLTVTLRQTDFSLKLDLSENLDELMTNRVGMTLLVPVV